LAIVHHHTISAVLYQISFSNTGSMKAICAQEYVEAETYNEAYAMGCSRSIGREVVVAVNPVQQAQSWRNW
jgi:hypothetical protein